MIGGLARCRIIAGEKGDSRQIQYVTVMEVPDTIQWLKGEDLLLTSLYPIKDDPRAQQQLVQQLDEKGSSALAIKTHRFVDRIPEMIIAEGNRLGFPIIEIERDISYLDIITPIMNVILENTSPRQTDYDELFHWITELALGGKGLDAIVQALSKMMKNLVTLESAVPFIKGLYLPHEIAPLTASQVNELRKSKRPLRMVRKLNGQLTSCIVSPLMLNEKINGYITCWETTNVFRKIDFDVLERAIPLFALEFLKAKTRVDVEQEYKNDFLSEVLAGNVQREAAVIEKAKWYSWDLTKDYQVMVLDVDQFSTVVETYNHDEVRIQEFKRNVAAIVENTVKRMDPSSIVVFWSDKIVVLYPMGERKEETSLKDDFLAAARRLKQHLKKQFSEVTFTIGMGRFYGGLRGIHLGYTEALQSIQAGRKTWGRDSIIHFDDLGIYRILRQLEHHEELDSIYQETIGKLEKYDQQHQSNLMETLEQYFACDCGLTETAANMYIHVNTLKYRLRKIEQITGYQLQDTEGRFHLYLGFKIKAMLNNRP
ncbi:PucR family transcriptional regulator ligand-binding domain-containing protein [Brevibacillus humidisoli]|uniref:PucR family transcriptional regulator n=1 Tax=Brevibacillus humidisoli TaxID=2895522 RepID=UPI001E3E309B|nr:PucR family transcriptional regulator [Brevibacillus humidisoli]UFJ41790.1 PucR family transcriptional regulator ligand-binding domain-containing protein [Brevibacillus humidisoli]